MKISVTAKLIVVSGKAKEYNMNGQSGISYRLGVSDINGDETGEIKCTEEVYKAFSDKVIQRFKEIELILEMDTSNGGRIVGFVPNK
ncbi:MAG: hypothetical protein PUD20_01740 [bacterium]|nr:hypothetical protein [bacterium]